MVRWIAVGVTTLGMIIVSVFFLEDRYHKIADAKDAKTVMEEKIANMRLGISKVIVEDSGVGISKESLETFKDVQQSLKSMQRDNDNNSLNFMRNDAYLLKKQFKADPSNELLEERIEMIQRQIEKLEIKLYN